MKRLWLAMMALLLSTGAYAVEKTVADFDGGADPVNLGGATFPFQGVGGEWGSANYDNTIYLGPTGQSLHVQWGNVSATDRYAGGGLFFTAASGADTATTDISAYNTISFWVYTKNPGTKAEVQLQDKTGGIAHTAKVKLTDYLTTGTSTWQEVSIPLAAFQRSLSTLDLTKAFALVFSADYTNGLECDAAGNIYVDDVKFSAQHHAPARSLTYSGGDKGTANADDMPGDTLLWWTQAASTVTTNEVRVSVSTGCAISFIATPAANNTVAAGTTYYYAFQVRNDGNVGDRITFSTATINNTNPWRTTIYWDKDMNGSFTAGDVECWNSIGLLPDSTHYFLAGIYVPSSAVNNSSTTVRVTARDNYGSGANDSWPSGTNDDTLTADFSATCQAPALTVVKSTSTATAKPDGTVTYTVSITNNGSAQATNVQLIDVVPANMALSADASGAGATITYFAGSSWSGTRSASTTKIRWTWATINSGGGTASASFTAKVK